MSTARRDSLDTTTLGAITTKIGSGATPRGGGESYKDSGLSLIRSMNVYDFEFTRDGLAFIDDEQASQLENVTVERGDILLNITGASVARCCMVPPDVLPARVNQHVAIVRVDPRKADPGYVLRAINSPNQKALLLSIAQGGATREALTKEKIQNFRIPFPPLPTQHKIAAILSAYDDLIENNLRRNRILEDIAQVFYREWFVEFRFPGHEKFHLIDSPLGRIPQGWEVHPLSEFTDVIYGFAFKSDLFSGEPVGSPLVRIRDIPDGESATFTSEPADKRYFIQDGDILVGMDGDFHMSIWAAGHALQNQRVARFISNGSVGRQLLFMFLRTPIERFNATITGTTVAHLGDMHIKTIQLAVPPPNVLAAANEILDPLCQLGITLRKRAAILRRARELLLPRLISGELDVSDLDIAVAEDAA